MKKIHTKKLFDLKNKYKELFDLSNYPKSSKYFCSDNKKVVGKMKDEYGAARIIKFVGLKSKMYSILDENNNEKSIKDIMHLLSFRNFTINYFKKDSQTSNERNKV